MPEAIDVPAYDDDPMTASKSAATSVSSPRTRVYAGQSAQEREAERRDRLISAALEIFGTAGYAATSADVVCKAAKVSTKHFYQLYANKEDLLLDLYAVITSGSFAAAAASLEETADEHFTVQLTTGIRAYLQPILADPRVARVAFVEIVGVSSRVEEKRLGFRDGIIGLFESEGAKAVARGEVSPRNFRFLALCFNGAANVVVHDWSLDAKHAAAESLLDDLCQVAVELFSGSAARKD